MAAVFENETKRRQRAGNVVAPTGRPSRRGEWTAEPSLARNFAGLAGRIDGKLQFLPIVTPLQTFLHHQLLAATRSQAEKIDLAPLRFSIAKNSYREPEIVLVRLERLPHRRRPINGADLVMEIVNGSKEDRDRDLIAKRRDDPKARLPESWIVGPDAKTITMLALPAKGAKCKLHGQFRPGQTATPKLHEGLLVDVAACFAAGKGKQT
jgi:Uma2 family endonuclease